MLHTVVEEARLLLVTLAIMQEEGIQALPTIPWDSLQDDHAEDQVGYLFLSDNCNTAWLSKGKDWAI